MDIALCFDANYAMQAGVAIASICKSNMNEDIHFHLFLLNVNNEEKQKIKEIIPASQTVTFYDIDEKLLASCPVNMYLSNQSVAKYIRILIPLFVDARIKRILYLDSDVLVVNSLNELFKIDIGEKAIGAVEDPSLVSVESFNRLRISKENGYFNSGVLMINLSVWRVHEYSKKILAYIKEKGAMLIWEDQDALNAFFSNNCYHYNYRFNLQDDMLRIDRENVVYWKNYQMLDEAISHPAIIHFNGTRPWNAHCLNPFGRLWLHYLSETPWKKFKPVGNINILRVMIESLRNLIYHYISPPAKKCFYITIKSKS